MKTLWKVTYMLDNGNMESVLFEKLDDIKASIKLTYSKWIVKPFIEVERFDYVCWRVPNGSIIEAQSVNVYNSVAHL